MARAEVPEVPQDICKYVETPRMGCRYCISLELGYANISVKDYLGTVRIRMSAGCQIFGDMRCHICCLHIQDVHLLSLS